MEKFEFLAVSHIADKNRDILKRDVKMPNGNDVSGSLQLHIVQDFNLVDAILIDKDFSSKISSVDSTISKINRNFNIFQMFCVVFSFIMLAVFVFLLIIIDLSEHKYKLEHFEPKS